VIHVPLMPMLHPDAQERLKAWVEQGGRLLLGPLVGYRSMEFTAFTDKTFGGLEALIGAESSLRFTVHWVENETAITFDDGQSFHTRNWCEGLEATTGKAIAHYRGGYGDGHAAVIEHQLGDGVVMTLGWQPDEQTYLRLMRRLMAEAGVGAVAEGGAEVAVAPRGRDGRTTGYGVVNLSKSAQTIQLDASGTDLLSGATMGPEIALEPLQVVVLKL